MVSAASRGVSEASKRGRSVGKRPLWRYSHHRVIGHSSGPRRSLPPWIIGLVDDIRFVIGLRIATDQQSAPILHLAARLRRAVRTAARSHERRGLPVRHLDARRAHPPRQVAARARGPPHSYPDRLALDRRQNRGVWATLKSEVLDR